VFSCLKYRLTLSYQTLMTKWPLIAVVKVTLWSAVRFHRSEPNLVSLRTYRRWESCLLVGISVPFIAGRAR
jgi:hypothetical protein